MKDIAISHNSIFDTNISNNCKTTRAKIQILNRKRNAPEIKKNKLVQVLVTFVFCHSLIAVLSYECFDVKQVIEKSNKYQKQINR